MARKLVVIGGKRPQMQKAKRNGWTKPKERRFLAVLAETCNVTRACRAARVGVTSVYRRRKQNAAFRAGWSEAVATAYQQLELVLLERAFNGTEKVVTSRSGEPIVMRDYSNQLGLALLKLHRDTAAEANSDFPPEDGDEMRERLVTKLLRLKNRIEKDDSAGA